MQQYDYVYAEFRPRRLDDLRPGSEQYIGKRLRWCASWVIEREDSEEYAGEYAMMPVGEDGIPFAWAPSGDLDMTIGEPRRPTINHTRIAGQSMDETERQERIRELRAWRDRLEDDITRSQAELDDVRAELGTLLVQP